MSPLLYIIFNRPDHTRRSFERIRAQAPSVLYIAADAPRLDRDGEREKTDQARAVTEAVDWQCEVHRLYATDNMGCGRRISSAITEVLAHHETVITLEDDCIPDPTFFPFCDQMLGKYADDERIMSVSGNNFQNAVSRTDSSYYFSKYPHCWGWATWRRSWQHFDLEAWRHTQRTDCLASFCENEREHEYWTAMFDCCEEGSIDSWAMPWTLSCWLQNGLTILPNVNLVSNIGFGETGTHTLSDSPYANLPVSAIDDLRHPTTVFRHRLADQFTDDLLYSGPWRRQRKKRRRFFSLRRSA